MILNKSDSAISIRHIGIIPDGARRWAVANQVPLDKAYFMTMELITRYIDLFYSSGVSTLSIYLASSDNIEKREEEEVRSFINAQYELITTLLPSITTKWSCRIKIAGMSSSVTNTFQNAVEKYSQFKEGTNQRSLYLLINYDPMAELQYVMQNFRDEPLTLSNFWVPEYVDCIIRTSDAQRLSNFLPLQSGYAELYFLPKFFLDTNAEDMFVAYRELTNRTRRQGK